VICSKADKPFLHKKARLFTKLTKGEELKIEIRFYTKIVELMKEAKLLYEQKNEDIKIGVLEARTQKLG
jgi:hypothetical protein